MQSDEVARCIGCRDEGIPAVPELADRAAAGDEEGGAAG